MWFVRMMGLMVVVVLILNLNYHESRGLLIDNDTIGTVKPAPTAMVKVRKCARKIMGCGEASSRTPDANALLK